MTVSHIRKREDFKCDICLLLDKFLQNTKLKQNY